MNTPEASYHIPAAHTDQLDSALPHATGGEILSLLVGSNILPESMRDGRILPAVIYGAEPYRRDRLSGGQQGIADLLPADAGTLGGTLNDDYFNPHGALKQAAKSVRLMPPNPTEGRREHRGTRFRHPAYVVGAREGRYLFAEMGDDDFERHAALLEPLAAAYNIGIVAVGNQIVAGREYMKLPKPGVPAIIREVGQTIMHLPYREGAKVVLLREVVKTLEANRSPDYRHIAPAKRLKRPA